RSGSKAVSSVSSAALFELNLPCPLRNDSTSAGSCVGRSMPLGCGRVPPPDQLIGPDWTANHASKNSQQSQLIGDRKIFGGRRARGCLTSREVQKLGRSNAFWQATILTPDPPVPPRSRAESGAVRFTGRRSLPDRLSATKAADW